MTRCADQGHQGRVGAEMEKNEMSNNGASEAASGGIGFFGMLIIIGLLGFGPCAETCAGCGPTVQSTLEDIKCDAHKEAGELDEDH